MANNIVNYEKYVNAFDKIKDVESHLVYDSDKVEKPFITIVIPTYKRYDLIGEALESAINQQPVDFEWDIVVVDNEAYDGEENETTRIIKSFNCDRIRHYRHSRTTTLYDNHNLGFKLARGEWVMLLHDDDILLPNSLYKMWKAIKYLSKEKGKPLGGISAKYHLFKYDPKKPEMHKKEISDTINLYLSKAMNWEFKKLNPANVLCTGHIGGDAPTNGSTFKKEAIFKIGGFDPDIGVTADLITFYKLGKFYSIYSSPEPYGFYRWGVNDSMAPGTTYRILENCYKFREYIFSKNIFNRIYGWLFRSVLYDAFGECVLDMRSIASSEYLELKDYDELYSKRANPIIREFWSKFIKEPYEDREDLIAIKRAKRIEKIIRKEKGIK